MHIIAIRSEADNLVTVPVLLESSAQVIPPQTWSNWWWAL